MLHAKIFGVWILAATAFADWYRRFEANKLRPLALYLPPTLGERHQNWIRTRTDEDSRALPGQWNLAPGMEGR